jgi:formylglycine-generating enzyme required for sulfatase activity
MLEVRRILREVEPPRPSLRLSSAGRASTAIAEARRTSVTALQHALRCDLDWLVMKALEKDRARRYATANALSADLQRYLDDEPLVAGPPSAAYRLRKLMRRYRRQVLAAAAVLATAVAGASIAIYYAVQVGVLAEDLASKVGEFEQLKVVVLHQRALAQDATLHPPWPEKIPAMEAWLDDCRRLLAMRGNIEETMRLLRRRALPPTAEDTRRNAAGHPRFAELQVLDQRLQSLRHAQAIRSGAARPVEPALTNEQLALPLRSLNQLAWIRVAPGDEREVYGEEAFGLACARAAHAQAAGTADEWWVLDTLAWAQHANGLDDAARTSSAAAVAIAPAHEDGFARSQQRLAIAIEQPAAALAAATDKHARLAAQVAARQTYRFAADAGAAAFLHDTLNSVLPELLLLEQREMVQVQRRLDWARRIGELSRNHPDAKVTWAAARAAIASADGATASRLYRGQTIELRDQDMVGLVPLGADPVTKLWEFYDLRSAWDGESDPAAIEIPERGTGGTFAITGATGIVLVLLPGGTSLLGAQAEDPALPNHDVLAETDETLHPVTLAPFFLGKHELTQGQWARLWSLDEDLRHPSHYQAVKSDNGVQSTLAHPVEQVDWITCTALLGRHGMFLPTEAQWEYGCRGGSPTTWWPGAETKDLEGKANVLDRSGAGHVQKLDAAEPFDDRFAAHAPVATFAANGFGLHDVHGNVWEWCRDTYGQYGSELPAHGLRPAGTDPNRIFRGGSFKQPAKFARSANRTSLQPTSRHEYVGLRCARPIRAPD